MQRSPLGRVVKSCFDWFAALVLLIACLPALLVIAIAVKLDSPGPVFFRQRRHGLGGSVIKVTKFRTMRAESADWGGKQQARLDDDRVTRVGRFLRPTCLDELPQLLDVLRGAMSLVGPRPHPLELELDGVPVGDLVPSYHERHKVRPGITGLAQVNGNRGPVQSIEMCVDRVNYDLIYINEGSILLDIMILFKTINIPFQKGHSF